MDLQTAMTFVAGSRNGVLVTLKRDGRPQLSNISYAAGDDGVVRISITDSRAKTRNLRRDPRASLHVTSEDFWQYVVIEGSAELTPVAAAPDDPTAPGGTARGAALPSPSPPFRPAGVPLLPLTGGG